MFDRLSDTRIGWIVPSRNQVSESELRFAMPASVDYFVTRLSLRDSKLDNVRGMAGMAESAAQLLADTEPTFVMFHCTGASALAGAELARTVSDIAGCPAQTTTGSIEEALRSLHCRRIMMIGPYTQELAEGEGDRLTSDGFEIATNIALDIPIERWARLPAAFWVDEVLKAGPRDVDGVFISCTNIRASGAIAALEQKLGLPVVTSNQAAAWYALKACGVEADIPEYGSLFRQQIAEPA